jgi:hypothetical protein
MRLYSPKKIPTIVVQYRNNQFTYSRSNYEIINPWPSLHKALKSCFDQEPVKIGCFFNQKKIEQHWKKKLRPSDPLFFQIASDAMIIMKCIEVIYAASLQDPMISRLCIELTKNKWYQVFEYKHQNKKQYQDKGYLSHLKTSQQVAIQIYRIFKMKYSDLYHEAIEAMIHFKSEVREKSLPTGLRIYPIQRY